MMLTCSRAFSTDSIAHGSDPSAPPCAAAITRSASITPAIGACTIGNSVLNRSVSLRSGHMIGSFEIWEIGRGVVAPSTGRLAHRQAGELCVQALPDTPAPQRDPGPDRLDQPERPGALQKSVSRTQRAGSREAEDEQAIAILHCVTHEHRGHREQSEQAEGIHPCPRSAYLTKFRSFHGPEIVIANRHRDV